MTKFEGNNYLFFNGGATMKMTKLSFSSSIFYIKNHLNLSVFFLPISNKMKKLQYHGMFWCLSNFWTFLLKVKIGPILQSSTLLHFVKHNVLPVLRMVRRSPQFESKLMLEIRIRTRLLRFGLTLQWHSTPVGYSPGKFGDSRMPNPSLA